MSFSDVSKQFCLCVSLSQDIINRLFIWPSRSHISSINEAIITQIPNNFSPVYCLSMAHFRSTRLTFLNSHKLVFSLPSIKKYCIECCLICGMLLTRIWTILHLTSLAHHKSAVLKVINAFLNLFDTVGFVEIFSFDKKSPNESSSSGDFLQNYR